MSKTLVIILSETRASEVTFDNFKKNVIDPLNADLCVCIGIKPDYDYENPFYKLAKHRFIYTEPDDFGDAFDYAYENLKQDTYDILENVNTLYGKIHTPNTTTDEITYYGSTIPTDFTDDEVVIHSKDFKDPVFSNQIYGVKKSDNNTYVRQENITTIKKPLHWREFLKIKNQFLGGIKDPEHQHDGSSGILIFFRWFLLENLYKSGVIDQYDRFIITRSDYIYRLPHPKVELMDPEYIWIPDSEHYGGYTDRHVVLSRKHVTPYLNILNNFVQRSNEYFLKMKDILHADFILVEKKLENLSNSLFAQIKEEYSTLNDEQVNNIKKFILNEHSKRLFSDYAWNLEKLIKFNLEQNDVKDCVREFPYVMYSIRDVKSSSRWATGDYDEKLGYYIKYKSEYGKSKDYLTQFEASKLDINAYYASVIRI
jgi:hypothetical protein